MNDSRFRDYPWLICVFSHHLIENAHQMRIDQCEIEFSQINEAAWEYSLSLSLLIMSIMKSSTSCFLNCLQHDSAEHTCIIHIHTYDSLTTSHDRLLAVCSALLCDVIVLYCCCCCWWWCWCCFAYIDGSHDSAGCGLWCIRTCSLTRVRTHSHVLAYLSSV